MVFPFLASILMPDLYLGKFKMAEQNSHPKSYFSCYTSFRDTIIMITSFLGSILTSDLYLQKFKMADQKFSLKVLFFHVIHQFQVTLA